MQIKQLKKHEMKFKLFSLKVKELGYNEKRERTPSILKPSYKTDYLFPSLRPSYMEVSFSFIPFFSCSFSFFFLFSCDTSTVSSVSTSNTFVGGGSSFSFSLPLARVADGVKAGWSEEEAGPELGSTEGCGGVGAKRKAGGSKPYREP